MAKRKEDTAIQSHYAPAEYAELKNVAKIKDWSDKKTVENIVALFLSEFKANQNRIDDL